MNTRSSGSWLLAILCLLGSACAGASHAGTAGAAPDQPAAPLPQDQAPRDFRTFTPQTTKGDLDESFQLDAPKARRSAWVKDVLSQLTVQPRAAMTTGELATMARELALVARGIANNDVRTAVTKELDALLQALGEDPTATVTSRVRFGAARDRWTQRYAKSVEGLRGYFEDATPDITVPLALHHNDLHAAYLTRDDARLLVAVTSLLERALELNLDFAAAQDEFEKNAAAWRAVLHRGYAQFPWEGWLNGALDGSAWDRPATHQFVLLHPEPGVMLGLDNLRSSAADPTLMVHGLGYIHYFGHRADWFLGGAATVAATDDEQQGLAYGATALFGSTRVDSYLPHISIGLLWSDGEDDGLHLSLGLDVLRLASRGMDR